MKACTDLGVGVASHTAGVAATGIAAHVS